MSETAIICILLHCHRQTGYQSKTARLRQENVLALVWFAALQTIRVNIIVNELQRLRESTAENNDKVNYSTITLEEWNCASSQGKWKQGLIFIRILSSESMTLIHILPIVAKKNGTTTTYVCDFYCHVVKKSQPDLWQKRYEGSWSGLPTSGRTNCVVSFCNPRFK